jgi:phage/plasmid-associated DNA primase
MFIEIKTDHKGLIYLFGNNCDIEFIMKYGDEYRFFYKLDEIQEKNFPYKILEHFTFFEIFKCFVVDTLENFIKKNNYFIKNPMKIKSRYDYIYYIDTPILPDILYEKITNIPIKYKTVDEALNFIINEQLISDGTLGDLYYSFYKGKHIYDPDSMKWYNFNKYGIYQEYKECFTVARENIKYQLLPIIENRITTEIKELIEIIKSTDPESKESIMSKKKLKSLKQFRKNVLHFINTDYSINSTINYMGKTHFKQHGVSSKMDTIKHKCLGFNNGVYDLDKKEFRKGKPEELITMSVGYNYKPKNNKYIDRVKKLLKSMIPNEDEMTYLLKKSSLFLIHGTPIREFYSILGSGANGKGIYALLLNKMLGQYCGTMAPAYFDASIKTKDANSADTQAYRNILTRLVIIDEIKECFQIDAAKVKSMTSGNTQIEGRNRYDKVDTIFCAGFNLLFISNYALGFDMSATHGERMDQIKAFRNEFVDNPREDVPYEKKVDRELNPKIMTNYNYGLAMFHILSEYYDQYVNIDKLYIERPKIMEEERQMLKIENDPVGAFMTEYTEKTGVYEDKIIGNQLFTAFIDYNKGGNMRIQRPAFYQQLTNKHYELKDFHKQKVIRGIKFKKQMQVDDNLIEI